MATRIPARSRDVTAQRTPRPASKEAPATASYLYGVVSGSEPDLAGAPPGMPGAGPLRVLPVGTGRWLVLADVPRSSYDSKVLDTGLADLGWVAERAVAHEAVVEHLARSATVVPMKLFTLFASDERARAHVEDQAEELGRIIERIRGCREWGVRVVRGVAPAAPAASQTPAASGRQYLERRRVERERANDRAKAVGEGLAGLFAALARSSREARKRPPLGELGEGLLLDAAFLVEEKATRSFEKAVRDAAATLRREGCEVTLSGPWPAYNFIAEAEG